MHKKEKCLAFMFGVGVAGKAWKGDPAESGAQVHKREDRNKKYAIFKK